MIPLVRSIFHALLWDPMAVRRWLRGMAVSFAVGGVAFADQIAAVLGSPGAAKTVKIVALALAFIGGAISVGQQNPKDGLLPIEPPKGFAHLGIVLALLVALLAAIAFPALARDPAVVRAFRKANPCPATGKTSDACPGFVVDHRIPLCAGGPDDVRNMAWQSVADAKWKDGVERQLCARLKACPAGGPR